jgi:ATP-binding protein involved in chromosome partitioning
MRPTQSHLIRCFRVLQHENPLVSKYCHLDPQAIAESCPQGLPRSGTPANWPKPPKRRNIKGVDKVIAVSSAKGGVGKSTVAGMI